MLDAIVPAWNENETVADVVEALLDSGLYRVTVVDDGSTDDTVARATAAGARVIPSGGPWESGQEGKWARGTRTGAPPAQYGASSAVFPFPSGFFPSGPLSHFPTFPPSPRNLGKAQAMRAGLAATRSDPVGFFDADLRGFRPHHAVRFYRLAGIGYDMVCGLRDGVRWPTMVGPLITGERVVRRWVMREIPETCMDGYLVEIGMNHAAARGRTAVFQMDGVTIKHSTEKFGLIGGIQKEWRMFSRIFGSQRALDDCGSCDPNQCVKRDQQDSDRGSVRQIVGRRY